MNNYSLFLFSFVNFLCLSSGSSKQIIHKTNVFNIIDYGAVGDLHTDDSGAFRKTWNAACSRSGLSQTIVVPYGKAFRLNPIIFKGPCKSKNIHFQIQGTLTAPKTKWDIKNKKIWIEFTDINGLTVDGGGTINGKGPVWWDSCGNEDDTCRDVPRPDAIKFTRMDQLKLGELTHIDSPRAHISINNCKNVNAFKLKISAPKHSPNTDGFDISDSSNVRIYDSSIQTGDDCVAINSGASYIYIRNVHCGPGHGISIGSLGKHGEYATVEEVHVTNCTLEGTNNGLRIKTFPKGTGYVRKVNFSEITLINTKNPIIIDQFYSTMNRKGLGIKISDVSYSRVSGTSTSKAAIALNCDKSFGCTNILMHQVKIKAAASLPKVIASCHNAHGSATDSLPRVPCLH